MKRKATILVAMGAVVAIAAGCPGERQDTIPPATDPAYEPAPVTTPPPPALDTPMMYPDTPGAMPGDTLHAPGAPGTTGRP
jgi:hypothetical protein